MLQSKDELRALKETMRDDILLRVWGEHLDDLIDVQEIGRASCRERV